MAMQSRTRGRAINASKRSEKRILSKNYQVNHKSQKCDSRINPKLFDAQIRRVVDWLSQSSADTMPASMADWKQITARIRRARTSKDPQGQLASLFEKTSDAMVAFELAKWLENSGHNSDAAKWYSTAAERFRRAEWKTKARDAAVRLGGISGETPAEMPAENSGEFQLTPPAAVSEEKELPFETNPEALESVVAVSSEVQEATQQSADAAPEDRKRRRRGRRGG